MKNDRQGVLDTINRVYYNGLTTTSGGNISAMDENGTIYITPSSIDKGRLKDADIVEVTPNGEILGKHKPSIELPFHSNIYKLRKDIKAVVHAHAPAVVAYATARKIPNSAIAPCYERILGKITDSRYDIPGSLSLGDIIKEKFKDGFDCVMMDNHGATVGGTDLNHAFSRYEALDFCSSTMINAEILGGVKYPNIKSDYSLSCGTDNFAFSEEECEIRAEMCAFLSRSYNQKLVSTTFGTLAYKLPDGNILFNPDNIGRDKIKADDIIKYGNGKTSAFTGSVAYLRMILSIFDNVPEAVTVFISMPSAIMGFAVSNKEFDSRLIPESYIMLKNVTRLPHGISAENIAKSLSQKSPVAVIDNECVVTIGKNIVKAFDRMEVIDYSARSIIMASNIADIRPISDKETEDIDRVFNGW